MSVLEGKRTHTPAFVTDSDKPLAQGPYTSRLRDARVAAWLGISLGVLFTTCFVTGLYSHLQQDPVSWLPIPPRPAGLYRFTQGLHVISGTASIPVLLAKLWVVWPRFVSLPSFKSVQAAIHGFVERLLIFPLVAGGLFLLFTGTANSASWYPWRFDFRRTHYGVAWLTMGALVAHIGHKWAVTRAATRRGSPKLEEENPATGDMAEPKGPGLSRRGFLGTVAGASAVLTVATAGATVAPLRRVSVLGIRDPRRGPQGLPVNRSAEAAGVLELARDPGYRLVVEGNVRTPLALSVDDLHRLAQRSAALPIACVEGWSAQGRWRGIAIRDLLQMAGAPAGAEVQLESLERDGAYRISRLTSAQAHDRDALLATHLFDQPLDVQHGYPLRLIAPNRAGVLQTKWVAKMVVS